MDADTVTVIDALFNKYAGSVDPSRLQQGYSIVADSDGNGGLGGNLRMNINDAAVQEFLCDTFPLCGGFVADGW
jgi:hypothetical protein